MQTTAILKTFDDTFNILLQVLAAYPQACINTAPAEGAWTGGQIVRHLLKGSVADLLYGNVTPTERQPDLHVEPLRNLFLDFSIKMQSPDVLVPEDMHYEKAELMKGLEDTAARIRKAIQTLDLTATCLDFEMPQTGYLTRLEWICFYIVHTQRHTRQLQHTFQTVIRKTYA